MCKSLSQGAIPADTAQPRCSAATASQACVAALPKALRAAARQVLGGLGAWGPARALHSRNRSLAPRAWPAVRVGPASWLLDYAVIPALAPVSSSVGHNGGSIADLHRASRAAPHTAQALSKTLANGYTASRFEADRQTQPCLPGVVWGRLPSVSMPAQVLETCSACA